MAGRIGMNAARRTLIASGLAASGLAAPGLAALGLAALAGCAASTPPPPLATAAAPAGAIGAETPAFGPMAEGAPAPDATSTPDVTSTPDAAPTPGATPTPEATAAELTRWSAGLYRQARHDEAIAALSQWLAAHSGPEPAVRAALAIHQDALGLPDAAAATLAECPASDPSIARARTWLGLRGDAFASVLDDARRAVAASPRSAADRNNLGIALLYAGRPGEAREAFLAARELDPALPGALYNLAIVESVYFFDDDAARRWLAAYRRLDDADPDGLFTTLGGDAAVAADAGGPAAGAGPAATTASMEVLP